MTKFTVTALALAFCALMFVGCSTASSPGNCGCIEGNLCGWGFYKEADLVEGQTNGTCDPCAQPRCKSGVVVSRCFAEPVNKPAPEVETEAEAAGEAPIADFAPPAPAR